MVLFAAAGQTDWTKPFEDAFQPQKNYVAPNVLERLIRSTPQGGPSVVVQDSGDDAAVAKCRVALVDLDSKIGFLPDIVKAANAAQNYYHFRVVYLPVPSGAARKSIEGLEPQTYLPRLETFLKDTTKTLGVDFVSCFTKWQIAWEDDGGGIHWNYIAWALKASSRVHVISTCDLRRWAQYANVSYAKAVLCLCLAMLIFYDGRWKLKRHYQTVGCLFDFCERRDDIVYGLKKMKFDHKQCRDKIKDEEQLTAVDQLLKLPNTLAE
jgi:hypothetical protein